MSPLLPTDPPPRSAVSAFGAGFRAAWLSVLAYVVIGTYVGIGALTHDFGFGRGLHRAGMGGTGAGDPGVGARRRRRAARNCAGGGREQRASSSDGDLAAAAAAVAANAPPRAHSAR